MKKSTSLFFALLLSTQLMANESKQNIIDINSPYNESSISVGLTRNFTEAVPYQSTCQRTEVGPPINKCVTVKREVCTTIPSGPGHRPPAPNGPGHRPPAPNHGPSHSKTCRIEPARECRLEPSTRLVSYSCTKTRYVDRTVSDGSYHLRTIINVLNPEMLDQVSNCKYVSSLKGSVIEDESPSCGRFAFKVHSSNKHSLASRDDVKEMSISLVDKYELLQAVIDGNSDKMELDNGILKIQTGKINNLREINISLNIKQSRFLVDKTLDTKSVLHSNMQLRQLDNGRSEILIDLESQFKGFKDGKKHQVIAQVSVNLDGEYLGILPYERTATYGKYFK